MTSAAGTLADIVICIGGLNERELSVNFLVIQVDKFYAGRSGFFFFMRNTKGAKEEKFKWFQEHVAIRAVNNNRLAYDGVDTSLQSNIPVKDTAVILIDGDIPQLNAMKKTIDVYNKNHITYGKLN